MILTALKYKISIDNISDVSINIKDKSFKTNLHSKFDIVPDYNGLPMPLYEYKNKRELKEKNDKEAIDINNEFNNSRILVSPFVLMEGCSHECAFCCDSDRPTLLSFDPVKAVEYLSKLNKKYGIKYFLFLNNTINLSKKYINEFCDEIIRSGLDILWSDCARADNLDKETLVKMRKAGCIRLVYGMETASPRLLKYIDKEINLTRLKNILTWTNEAGIWSGLEVISGFPHETKEDLDMTIDFLRKNKKHINTIYNNIFYLIINGKMFFYPQKYGINNITDTDTFKYERTELKGLSRYGFDEIDGLKWKDKLRQMAEAYDYMQKNINANRNFEEVFDGEHLLFYLYSKYKDKKEVMRVFNKVGNS